MAERGTLTVTTQSGTAYEFDRALNRVRRVPVAGDEHAMRRDGEWLELRDGTAPLLGRPMVLLLEPLGEGDATQRTTSLVTAIDGDTEDENER